MYTTLISPQDVSTQINNKNRVIIDCRFSLEDSERGRRDYSAAHIPNALYVHLNEDLSARIIPGKTGRHPLPEVETLVNTFSRRGIDGDTHVVVYDDATGAFAARLWWMLRWLGHDHVAVLDGGWKHWLKAGFPATGEVHKRNPRTFIPKPRPRMLVNAMQVVNILNDSSYRILDARSPERFKGLNETIDPVAGHIPNAICAPFAGNVDAEGRMLSREKLSQRFKSLLGNIAPDHAIFYCGSGVTACHNLLAMYHAGLGDGVLYAGSWSEWITDTSRPVATLNEKN
ncbi:MAG: sulfurtransferase [Planctomycetes bacterium]|nr:sulfurtransferase [Planctomycetota bacterium]